MSLGHILFGSFPTPRRLSPLFMNLSFCFVYAYLQVLSCLYFWFVPAIWVCLLFSFIWVNLGSTLAMRPCWLSLESPHFCCLLTVFRKHCHWFYWEHFKQAMLSVWFFPCFYFLLYRGPVFVFNLPFVMSGSCMWDTFLFDVTVVIVSPNLSFCGTFFGDKLRAVRKDLSKYTLCSHHSCHMWKREYIRYTTIVRAPVFLLCLNVKAKVLQSKNCTC